MNKVYLLDANIISEFAKEQPDANVLALYEARKNLCAISSITWQEMIFSILRMPDGNQKNTLLSFMDNLKDNIEIVSYDAFAADICGKALDALEKAEQEIPLYDVQIGAAAISNGMVLVTRNTADFKTLVDHYFLRIENWFEE